MLFPQSATVAVVLPAAEGFGPRRSGRIGLTVRDLARADPTYRTVVFGGRQNGPVFEDVTFQTARASFFTPGAPSSRYLSGLTTALHASQPAMIEVHGDPGLALSLRRRFPSVPTSLFLYDDPLAREETATATRRAALLAEMTRIVTASAWLRDRLLDGLSPAPGQDPVVLPPGVDFSRLPVPAGRAANTPLARRRTPLILFVGRLAEEAGADRFVTACCGVLPHLPSWRAEMIGDMDQAADGADTPFMERLRVSAEPAGIGLMGYRDHPDVMAAMARAAIVVLCGREPDTSGRVVLEAMANGAAVICPEMGALPEIGGDAVLYADHTSLPDVMRALGSNPTRLAVISEAGRARAARFDIARIGERLALLRRDIQAGEPAHTQAKQWTPPRSRSILALARSGRFWPSQRGVNDRPTPARSAPS